MGLNGVIVQKYCVQALAAVGAIVLARGAFNYLSFAYFYLLRPSSLAKYFHGAPAYALVTGASDGIGKAVARELYDKGFNVILHGRSEEKTRQVADEIRERRAGDVRYFIADASEPKQDFEAMLKSYKDCNITLVVHNVGGSRIHERVDSMSESSVISTIHLNAIFPLLLTRALLPRLRSSAKYGPVMVQFVGSVTADMSPAGVAVYGASKAFIRAVTRGLDNDERTWGQPSGVRFSYLSVASVVTSSNRGDVTTSAPSADQFAKALVSSIGCGYRSYAPWMVHAATLWVLGAVREGVVDNMMIKEMKKVREKQDFYDGVASE
ncbi:Very-long-chain 3-oxoacyl-CoA reductase [Sparassis crispa]|uniref:Very-long-chain 3-oxoacyl-CoA reductase n=1 Tax=Sparassis crispa TaxID=139825 RepID=A0A401GZI0_9APHY|nr:Very-long-chain 3-oxoacyl-CoA reductase [Sparassis crispa]GBE87549.1 Very-long-chain 3-oxoacyl-CoA reductase [Sparassis crispa]